MRIVQLNVIEPSPGGLLAEVDIWVREEDGAVPPDYRGRVTIETAILADLYGGWSMVQMLGTRAGLRFVWSGCTPPVAATAGGAGGMLALLRGKVFGGG